MYSTPKKSRVIRTTLHPLTIATKSLGLVVGAEACLWWVERHREMKTENSGSRQLFNEGESEGGF